MWASGQDPLLQPDPVPCAWIVRRVGRQNTPKGARHCSACPTSAAVGGHHARLSERCSSSARVALGCLSGLVEHTLISGDTCSQHGQFGWWYARKEGAPTRRSQPLPKLQLSLRLERRQLSACSRRVPAYVAVAAVWALAALTISHCSPSYVLLVESAVSASNSSCGYGGLRPRRGRRGRSTIGASAAGKHSCAGCNCVH